MIPQLFQAKPRLQWSSAVNLVWDGNSLVAGVGNPGQPLPAMVAAAAPVTGSGAATTNVGIAGQAWSDMTATATDVDGAWVSGKTNVLVLWETTNSIINNAETGAQAMTDATAYITARRAVHPWVVVVLTTIPRESGTTITDQTTRTAQNLQLVAADTLLKANFATIGADVVCDVRQAGSPFAFAAYTPADFDASGAIWYESTPSRVHLNAAGYGVVANYVAASLRKLPKVAH